LKENVITGTSIPAGTGIGEYENYIVGSKEEYELLQTAKVPCPSRGRIICLHKLYNFLREF